MKKFVTYFRVSTSQQGKSGLGLEAQGQAVATYLNGVHCEVIATFTEVETGKGANALDKRPQLRNALSACRKHGAILIIAKLDRLARNVHFITGLIEAGCEFIAADMPNATKAMLQMYAVMSEWERDQIAARTKAALAAAKLRGVVLGRAGSQNLNRNIAQRQAASNIFVNKLRGQIEGFKLRGLSQRVMVTELNYLGIKAPKGGEWSLSQFQRLLYQSTGSQLTFDSL